jgi:hypothetical protein
MLPLPDESEVLGVETHLLSMAKKIFLFVGGTAVQKYMQSLKEEQEILANLANIIIEIYAIESALLRTKKALERGQDASHKIDMVRVYTQEAFNRIADYARDTLSWMEEGDVLRTQLAVLRKLTRFQPINTKELKRQIAARVIEEEAYLA